MLTDFHMRSLSESSAHLADLQFPVSPWFFNSDGLLVVGFVISPSSSLLLSLSLSLSYFIWAPSLCLSLLIRLGCFSLSLSFLRVSLAPLPLPSSDVAHFPSSFAYHSSGSLPLCVGEGLEWGLCQNVKHYTVRATYWTFVGNNWTPH